MLNGMDDFWLLPEAIKNVALRWVGAFRYR